MQLSQLFNLKQIETFTSFLVPIIYDNDEDAELILELRKRKSDNFLKTTSFNITDQKLYLEKYIIRNKKYEEIYFKIFDKVKKDYKGVVRITELLSKENYNWESFVVAEDCTPILPIDVMISIYQIGFEYLDKEKIGPWCVNKEHKKMMKIHEKCNMYCHEFEDNNYFWISVKKTDYFDNVSKFKKMGLGIKMYAE